MTKAALDVLLYAWIALAIALIPLQLTIVAPYGRHRRDHWGPQIGNRLGWLIMEVVALVAFDVSFLWSGVPASPTAWIIFALWQAHYLNRSLLYPLRTKTAGKHIPVVIVGFSIMFNAFNGWSNGHYLGASGATHADGWLVDARFLAGLSIFLTGAAINIWADNTLISLRRPGGEDYVVPHGGLFDYVSSPNYLGEIVEWTGFAILCWNLPALAFAIWTATNLGPRAWRHHRWYKKMFPSYPAERKALIPYVL